MSYLACNIGAAAVLAACTLCMLGALNSAWWRNGMHWAGLWEYEVAAFAGLTTPYPWDSLCGNANIIGDVGNKVCRELKWVRASALATPAFSALSAIFTGVTLCNKKKNSRHICVLVGRLFLDTCAGTAAVLAFVGAHKIRKLLPNNHSFGQGVYLAGLAAAGVLVSVILVFATVGVGWWQGWLKSLDMESVKTTMSMRKLPSHKKSRQQVGSVPQLAPIDDNQKYINGNGPGNNVQFGGGGTAPAPDAFGMRMTGMGSIGGGNCPGVAPPSSWGGLTPRQHQEQQLQQLQQLQQQQQQQRWLQVRQSRQRSTG